MESTVRDTVCSFSNLYSAMKKSRRNVMWKDSVARYLANALVNIYKLKKSLDDDSYKISPYTHFKVYEPKERNIVSTRMKDRVFQRSLCDNYFYDTMTKSFINDNVACQMGKGTEYGRERLVTHMRRFFRKHGLDGYIYKFDLSNYFGSTSHDIATKSVTDRSDDVWANSEAKRVIDSYDEGMGLGSQMTQLIELAVLDKLDHYIKERLRIKHYVRYNDDMILIHDDKLYLLDCGVKIRNWLTEHDLKVNDKKTKIFPFKQGVKFLGFKFRPTETGKIVVTLLPEKLSHERRKLMKLVDRAKAGLMTKSDVDSCYQSWKAHVSNGENKTHRDTHNIILAMDQYYKKLWTEVN